MNHSQITRLIFVFACFISACAGASRDGALSAAGTSQAIVGGEEVDYAFPGIGLLTTGGPTCTATLIGSNAILTAAHCFEYGSQTDQQLAGFFAYATGADGSRPYSVDVIAYQSLPAANEDDDPTDLAVAMLADNIAGDPVPPFGIATSFPPAEEDVDIFGFGCDDPTFNSDTGDWDCPLGETAIKREVGVPWSRWNSDDMTLTGD
ncbi:MAG TPA: trypsin-like serine protease, partial [Polyangiales bacterium]|nr:trypsin-like serine protease [Polyangiales bacterium]